jgi:predicted ATP-dependent endonuclease of OLD family
MEDILNDKHADNFLKPINSLKKEFVDALKSIFKDSEKSTLLLGVIQILSEESSLHFIRVISNPTQESELIKIFSELSTGHKFVLHSLANIIKHIENRSLILFDEPETHLHPPLLAVLMKSMRWILNNKNSFLILSTHSPVVLQETLSKHVFIVRREGNITQIRNPDIQTFGENIGIITSHIFGLSSDLTDYHTELDQVISNSRGKTPKEGLEKIEALFEGKLSFQARAYILAQLNN